MAVRRYLIAGVGALALATASSASLFTLELSTHSSEPGIDPSILAATMTFSVTGQTLTLTVTNNTSGVDSYSINRIFFNADASVGNLVSSSTGQFDVNVVSGNANGFGIFDYVLSHGPEQGHNHHLIGPGGSQSFDFTFDGIVSAKAFTLEFSEPFDGNQLMQVAAKFVMGPGDASAYGAFTIPAPGVLALLAAAGFVGCRRRRRRG